jgi:hypothetical protein
MVRPQITADPELAPGLNRTQDLRIPIQIANQLDYWTPSPRQLSLMSSVKLPQNVSVFLFSVNLIIGRAPVIFSFGNSHLGEVN